MKETSRIRSSRCDHGLRPRTVSCPSYGMRPRMALSAVVLPAPFGPMSPTIRPSSIRKAMPSKATVAPKVFRKPRASMHCIPSALLLPPFRLGHFPLPAQELFRTEAKALNVRVDPRPLFTQKLLPLALHQRIARSFIDEHAQTASGLHQTFVRQLLVSLEDRDRIDPVFGRDRAHRRKRIAFLQNSVENHRHHPVANLTVDRLPVVPLTVHPVSSGHV